MRRMTMMMTAAGMLVTASASAGGFEDAFRTGEPFTWCRATAISKMSLHDVTMCEGILRFKANLDTARAEGAAIDAAAAEEARKARSRRESGYRDPGAAPIGCAPPHRLTARDGCQ